MFKKYPKVTFSYSRFLDPVFIAYIKSLQQHKDWVIPDIKDVTDNVDKYRMAWIFTGDITLKGMVKATGMSFKRSLIPVYVVSGNPRPFNNPMVITHRYSVAEFRNIMVHELTHCLFTDNGITDEMVQRVFPHRDPTTSVHIPVYAVMEYISQEVLKTGSILVKNAYQSEVNTSYDMAIEQVKKHGYKTIINAIKKELR